MIRPPINSFGMVDVDFVQAPRGLVEAASDPIERKPPQ